MDKTNVLIVEDHALTRFAMMTSLREQDFIDQIHEATDAAQAYDILNKNKIHIVLMDLGLPGIDGVRATQEIKKIHKDVRVIIVTSHNEEVEVLKCLEAGISAYCTKDIKPEKLIELIKDVKNGSMWFDSAVSQFIQNVTRSPYKLPQGNREAKKSTANNQNVKEDYNLTSKEKKVLELIKIGNSNSEISRKLNITVNTVKVHVCSILQKLDVEDRTQAAIKALNQGIPG